MTESVVLRISRPNGRASTNQNRKRRPEKPLVSSARARAGVLRLSTMTYESKPNSSYDRSSVYGQRRVPALRVISP